MPTNPKKQNGDHSGVSPELKLEIREAVESSLEKLPAATYRLIEEMVESRVAKYERMYRIIGLILIGAITVVSVAFYKITSDNASETVAKAIGSTEVKKQAIIVEKLFLEAQETKNKLVHAAVEGINAGESLSTRLHELEQIDNIVRYSPNGNLILSPRDGEVRLRRPDSGQEIMLYLGTNGVFKIWDGTNAVDPIRGEYWKPVQQ